jgi:hypothetical protein
MKIIRLKQIIKEELKKALQESHGFPYPWERKETYVLERSGVTFNKKFVTGGKPDDPNFGTLEDAKTFASKGAAEKYAEKVEDDGGPHLSVKNKKELE